MNYSKNRNLRKAAIGKRVILSWVIIGMVCYIIGGVSGYALKTHIIAKNKPNEEEQTIEQVQLELSVFGAYDGSVSTTEEVSINWGAGDLDFTPLDVPMSEEEQEFIFYLAAGYNVDFALVMAMIQHESKFQPNAVSNTQDYGLMQINTCNHDYLTKMLGVTDFLDPYQNIRAGMFTLRKLFEKYQDTDMVLMAYNMGENGASRLWEQGIYETSYTQDILSIQQQFNEQLEGDADAGKLENN